MKLGFFGAHHPLRSSSFFLSSKVSPWPSRQARQSISFGVATATAGGEDGSDSDALQGGENLLSWKKRKGGGFPFPSGSCCRMMDPLCVCLFTFSSSYYYCSSGSSSKHICGNASDGSTDLPYTCARRSFHSSLVPLRYPASMTPISTSTSPSNNHHTAGTRCSSCSEKPDSSDSHSQEKKEEKHHSGSSSSQLQHVQRSRDAEYRNRWGGSPTSPHNNKDDRRERSKQMSFSPSPETDLERAPRTLEGEEWKEHLSSSSVSSSRSFSRYCPERWRRAGGRWRDRNERDKTGRRSEGRRRGDGGGGGRNGDTRRENPKSSSPSLTPGPTVREGEEVSQVRSKPVSSTTTSAESSAAPPSSQTSGTLRTSPNPLPTSSSALTSSSSVDRAGYHHSGVHSSTATSSPSPPPQPRALSSPLSLEEMRRQDRLHAILFDHIPFPRGITVAALARALPDDVIEHSFPQGLLHYLKTFPQYFLLTPIAAGTACTPNGGGGGLQVKRFLQLRNEVVKAPSSSSSIHSAAGGGSGGSNDSPKGRGGGGRIGRHVSCSSSTSALDGRLFGARAVTGVIIPILYLWRAFQFHLSSHDATPQSTNLATITRETSTSSAGAGDLSSSLDASWQYQKELIEYFLNNIYRYATRMQVFGLVERVELPSGPNSPEFSPLGGEKYSRSPANDEDQEHAVENEERVRWWRQERSDDEVLLGFRWIEEVIPDASTVNRSGGLSRMPTSVENSILIQQGIIPHFTRAYHPDNLPPCKLEKEEKEKKKLLQAEEEDQVGENGNTSKRTDLPPPPPPRSNTTMSSSSSSGYSSPNPGTSPDAREGQGEPGMPASFPSSPFSPFIVPAEEVEDWLSSLPLPFISAPSRRRGHSTPPSPPLSHPSSSCDSMREGEGRSKPPSTVGYRHSFFLRPHTRSVQGVVEAVVLAACRWRKLHESVPSCMSPPHSSGESHLGKSIPSSLHYDATEAAAKWIKRESDGAEAVIDYEAYRLAAYLSSTDFTLFRDISGPLPAATEVGSPVSSASLFSHPPRTTSTSSLSSAPSSSDATLAVATVLKSCTRPLASTLAVFHALQLHGDIPYTRFRPESNCPAPILKSIFEWKTESTGKEEEGASGGSRRRDGAASSDTSPASDCQLAGARRELPHRFSFPSPSLPSPSQNDKVCRDICDNAGVPVKVKDEGQAEEKKNKGKGLLPLEPQQQQEEKQDQDSSPTPKRSNNNSIPLTQMEDSGWVIGVRFALDERACLPVDCARSSEDLEKELSEVHLELKDVRRLRRCGAFQRRLFLTNRRRHLIGCRNIVGDAVRYPVYHPDVLAYYLFDRLPYPSSTALFSLPHSNAAADKGISPPPCDLPQNGASLFPPWNGEKHQNQEEAAEAEGERKKKVFLSNAWKAVLPYANLAGLLPPPLDRRALVSVSFLRAYPHLFVFFIFQGQRVLVRRDVYDVVWHARREIRRRGERGEEKEAKKASTGWGRSSGLRYRSSSSSRRPSKVMTGKRKELERKGEVEKNDGEGDDEEDDNEDLLRQAYSSNATPEELAPLLFDPAYRIRSAEELVQHLCFLLASRCHRRRRYPGTYPASLESLREMMPKNFSSMLHRYGPPPSLSAAASASTSSSYAGHGRTPITLHRPSASSSREKSERKTDTQHPPPSPDEKPLPSTLGGTFGGSSPPLQPPLKRLSRKKQTWAELSISAGGPPSKADDPHFLRFLRRYPHVFVVHDDTYVELSRNFSIKDMGLKGEGGEEEDEGEAEDEDIGMDTTTPLSSSSPSLSFSSTLPPLPAGSGDQRDDRECTPE